MLKLIDYRSGQGIYMLPATQPRWAYKVRSTVIGPAGYKAVKPLQYWITIVYLSPTLVVTSQGSSV